MEAVQPSSTHVGRTLLIAIVVVVILYLIYAFFLSNSNDKTLVTMQDARTSSMIQPTSMPSTNTTDFTYSVWIYVNDWNYRIGEEKVIFSRTLPNTNQPAPIVSLGANTNNVNVSLETYTNGGGTTVSNCQISDVPLQKWVNLIISVNGRALDLYVDGKLVRTCVLGGVPKVYYNAPVALTPNGGFSGYVSNFRFIGNAINPSQAYDIYRSGFGGAGSLSDMINKYRIKFAFVENNKEVNSFEL